MIIFTLIVSVLTLFVFVYLYINSNNIILEQEDLISDYNIRIESAQNTIKELSKENDALNKLVQEKEALIIELETKKTTKKTSKKAETKEVEPIEKKTTKKTTTKKTTKKGE